MTGMGCRAREECKLIQNEDLVYGPDSKSSPGLPEFISLSERVTKTRRGNKNDLRDLDGKVYLDEEFPELCPVRTIIIYQSRKTNLQLSPTFSFFLTVKQSAEKSPNDHPHWYSNHPMGVNMIGSLFKKAIDISNVDIGSKKATATSARKCLTQAGAESSVPSPFLSKMLGQKNIDSKLEYLKQTDATHKAASLVINRSVKGQDGQNFSTVYNDLKENAEETKQEPLEAPNPENYNHQSPQTNYQPPQTEYWHPQTEYQHPQTNYQPPQTSYYPPQTPYPPQAPYYPPPQPCYNNCYSPQPYYNSPPCHHSPHHGSSFAPPHCPPMHGPNYSYPPQHYDRSYYHHPHPGSSFAPPHCPMPGPNFSYPPQQYDRTYYHHPQHQPQWSNYDYGQQNVQGKSYGNKRALEDVTNKETPSSSSHNFTFKKPKNDNFDNNYVLTEL